MTLNPLAEILGATLALATVAFAQQTTRQFLDAPIIQGDIRVQWDPSGKALQWLRRDNSPVELNSSALFLSKGPVNVTYPRMNPLRLRATASAAAAADPSVATVGKLVDAITAIVSTVAPIQGGNAPAGMLQMLRSTPVAPEFSATTACNVTVDLTQVDSLITSGLFPSTSLGDEVLSWVTSIDLDLRDNSGDAAITNAATKIGNDITIVADRISQLNAAITHVHSCAQGTSANDYHLPDVVLHDSPIVRELTALQTAMKQLQTELMTTYAVPASWVGQGHRDFRLNTTAITPTLEQMQNVTLKVSSIDLSVDNSTNGLTVNRQDVTTVTFPIRRYSFLTPELGVGAVFGTIKKPTYGTGKNDAGQTVVTKSPDTSVSVNPTVMVNFVCRCSAGALVPIFQMGAAASKDTPAILGGAGLRLFGLGKGDFAISGGAMFSWVKDLQKLKPGDVVSGTSDINSDLGYSGAPKVGGYFAILYKF